ncbi:hypothetical protein PAXRUDRAFT_831567 [Paxillus rubicundulus Ve08.2h10]|uniref:Uncharacterized protein n=1 Tax=Paxillus rubicundulus Ve08.2h10 TaxID=930991 RepID=A0A0D0D261_9AGAM|nr:hypothetical protein PAXRUDRAFT_831567 [Paxillus rubicundulus Ve08.2h10]
MSSPTSAAQARRRSQYKSAAPRAQTSYRSPDAPAKLLFRSGSQTSEDPQKSFLRERFQARCRERAQKLRERAVSSRRSSGASSDEFMDCDEEETEDAIMQDELFRRIVQSANHKKQYAYRVSYSLEVGSSFDPDLEDASVWESELREDLASSIEPTPDELEEEELREYAQQCDALEDFTDADLAVDDFSAFSDIEDLPLNSSQGTPRGRKTHQDSDMDMS